MNGMITVGIADMKVVRNEGTLITYALGSCVGICLYDPEIKLACMAHIMLPVAPSNGFDNVFKYANTGIAESVRKMVAFGAVQRRLRAKIAGGSKMFDIPGDSGFGNIGARNIESVTGLLRREGIVITGQDVGGNFARTMLFSAESGSALIRTFGHSEKSI